MSRASFLRGEVALPNTGVLRVFQITDTHLMAQSGGRLLNVDTDDSLAAVIAVAAQQPTPDALLITGDIAGDAAPDAYYRLERALAPLAAPSFWLPGNHDGCDGADVDFVHFTRQITSPYWHICMLNSQVAEEVGGYLAAPELDALAWAVDSANATGRHLLVALHHPLLKVGCAWLDEQRVGNADAFFAEIARCQHGAAVISGHVHQESEQLHQNVRYFTAPSTCIQFAPGQTDFRLDDKNPGFRWLELHPDGSLVTAVERVTDRTFPIDPDSGGYI